MLTRLILKNVFSFKEEQELNLIAGSYQKSKNHLYPISSDISVLKYASIYGANAAGKTNILWAISKLKKIVTLGTKDKGDNLGLEPFRLSEKSILAPSEIKVEIFAEKKRYYYGIAVFDNIIQNEWLYELLSKNRSKLIFDRKTNSKGKTTIKLGDIFGKTSNSKTKQTILGDLTRSNQPFIFEGSNREIKELIPFTNWFKEELQIVYPNKSHYLLIKSFATNKKFTELANEFLKLADLGIDKIRVAKVDLNSLFGIHEQDKKRQIINGLDENNAYILEGGDDITYSIHLNSNNVPEAAYLQTIHKSEENQDIIFDMKEESKGTNRVIALIPAMIDSLNNGYTYFIDQLDDSIHPSLLKDMMRVLLRQKYVNPGQMIFTSHAVCLLDLKLFRQDEIWFVEKEKNGASHLYSLSDFKPRYDKDVQKGYLEGKFGAIPLTDININLN